MSEHSEEFPTVTDLPVRPAPPDPFETFDGDRITSAEAWRERRRPELKALFRRYVYGFEPTEPAVTFDVERADEPACGGAGDLATVRIGFPESPTDDAGFDLAVFTPRDRDGPHPVVLVNSPVGVQTVADHPALPIPEGSPRGPESRGQWTDAWQIDAAIDRGYAFAAVCRSDVDPDRHHDPGIKRGLRGPSDPTASAWGTLAAWAWGISRCVDYLTAAEAIDSDGIAAFGQSRGGKAALLAAAFDERIDMVVPHQSGTGGLALSRDNEVQPIAEAIRKFPYWFNGTFPAFATRVECLPVDQHLLASLVAPRAILDTEGAQRKDPWANPDSALAALELATDAYELVGDTPIDRNAIRCEGGEIPADAPPLLQYRLDAEHGMTPEFWDAVYRFGDLHLRGD